jgi:heptosyltransferase-2
MSLPTINEVREAYPGSTVDIITPAPLADLFAGNPNIDHIIPIPPGHVHGLVAVVKIRELISDGNYDTGFILPPSFGAAASFKLAGVPQRIGYIADGRRLLLTRALPLPKPLNAEHRSETYFNLLRRAVGQELSWVRPKLFLSEEDADRGTAVLNEFGMDDTTEYVTVACQAVAESRRWGLDNYTSLAKQILDSLSAHIVLVGGKDESEASQTLADALPSDRVVNLAGKTNLREAAAILSRALLFVGNDSGAAHLAAAVGTPVVVLSGADDPRETSPVTDRKELVYLDQLECISCVKNRCPIQGEGHMACMRGISVAAVVDAVSAVLPT